MPDIITLVSNITEALPTVSRQYGGWVYLLIFAIILLGSCFVIAPLPVDSLLFVSGALAMNRELSTGWVLIAGVAGAYFGYDINYWSGRLLGIAICRRGCPHIFGEREMETAQVLFEKYGPASIIIIRFIPVVNLPPFFAGLDKMAYRRYILFNLTGAVIWPVGVFTVGYFFGGLGIVRVYLGLLFDLVLLVVAIGLFYAGIMFIRGRITGSYTG